MEKRLFQFHQESRILSSLIVGKVPVGLESNLIEFSVFMVSSLGLREEYCSACFSSVFFCFFFNQL